MSMGPKMPPIAPNSGNNIPPSRPDPTMVVDHTDLNTPENGHIIGKNIYKLSTTSVDYKTKVMYSNIHYHKA